MKTLDIIRKLQYRENWTPELIWVHKTRLIIGAIIGFAAGFIVGLQF